MTKTVAKTKTVATIGGFSVDVTRAYPAKPDDAEDGVKAYFSANLVDNEGNVNMALNGMQLVTDLDGNFYVRTMKKTLRNGKILSAFTFFPGAVKNDALSAAQRKFYGALAQQVRETLEAFNHPDLEELFED